MIGRKERVTRKSVVGSGEPFFFSSTEVHEGTEPAGGSTPEVDGEREDSKSWPTGVDRRHVNSFGPTTRLPNLVAIRASTTYNEGYSCRQRSSIRI